MLRLFDSPLLQILNIKKASEVLQKSGDIESGAIYENIRSE